MKEFNPDSIVIPLLDEIGDKIGSVATVMMLVRPNVSEYERGTIAGKIELLGEIKTGLIPKPVEQEKVIKEKSVGTDDRVKYEKS